MYCCLPPYTAIPTAQDPTHNPIPSAALDTIVVDMDNLHFIMLSGYSFSFSSFVEGGWFTHDSNPKAIIYVVRE